jgi:DNA-binding MarR family transcriptional regulator
MASQQTFTAATGRRTGSDREVGVTEAPDPAVATATGFDKLAGGIARARYAMRKVFRIVDEQARSAGIDPLHHQALIQIYGSDKRMLHVTELAERLDVPAALASRLVTGLELRELVRRERSLADLRMIEVHVTDAGVELLRSISAGITEELRFFSRRLSTEDKMAALRVMAAYIGLQIDGDTVTEIPNA